MKYGLEIFTGTMIAIIIIIGLLFIIVNDLVLAGFSFGYAYCIFVFDVYIKLERKRKKGDDE